MDGEITRHSTIIKYLEARFLEFKDESLKEFGEIHDILEAIKNDQNKLCKDVLRIITINGEKEKYVDKKTGLIFAIVIGVTVSAISFFFTMLITKSMGG